MATQSCPSPLLEPHERAMAILAILYAFIVGYYYGRVKNPSDRARFNLASLITTFKRDARASKIPLLLLILPINIALTINLLHQPMSSRILELLGGILEQIHKHLSTPRSPPYDGEWSYPDLAHGLILTMLGLFLLCAFITYKQTKLELERVTKEINRLRLENNALARMSVSCIPEEIIEISDTYKSSLSPELREELDAKLDEAFKSTANGRRYCTGWNESGKGSQVGVSGAKLSEKGAYGNERRPVLESYERMEDGEPMETVVYGDDID